MLRLEKDGGWILVTHREHAKLAGHFAEAVDTTRFAKPGPVDSVIHAVFHHDDSWIRRDAEPFLTPEGLPSAFSRELVGSYDAFEEIDMEDYLAVRGEATEAAAMEDRFAGILISMHTDNLLTEQADLSALSEEEMDIHGRFISQQRARRLELIEELLRQGMDASHLSKENLREGFEFLQACDSFSLYACTDFPEPIELRHGLSRVSGEKVEVVFRRIDKTTHTLDPWPFVEPSIRLKIDARFVPGFDFPSLAAFRQAYAEAVVDGHEILLKRLECV
ncbi:MAG: DUF3891 family protein [Verrucomicrobiota bacterium]